jgi:hypothetical protein
MVHKDTILVSLVLIVGTCLHVPTSELLLIAPSLALLACVPTHGNQLIRSSLDSFLFFSFSYPVKRTRKWFSIFSLNLLPNDYALLSNLFSSLRLNSKDYRPTLAA